MDEYAKKVRECAEQGEKLVRQMAVDGTLVPVFLYCTPSQVGRPGKICLVKQGDPVGRGQQLVSTEPLQGNVPYEGFFQWVYERARRAPILAMETSA